MALTNHIIHFTFICNFRLLKNYSAQSSGAGVVLNKAPLPGKAQWWLGNGLANYHHLIAVCVFVLT